jgi:hypothetical protein
MVKIKELQQAIASQMEKQATFAHQQEAYSSLIQAAVSLSSSAAMVNQCLGFDAPTGATEPNPCDIIAQTKSALENLVHNYQDIRRRLENLELSSTSQTASIQEELQAAKDEIGNVVQRLAEAEEIIAELDLQRHQLSQDVDAKAEQLAAMQVEVEDARAQAQTLEQQHVSLQQKINGMSRSLDQSKEEHQRQISFLEKENVQLMMELRTLRSNSNPSNGQARPSFAPGRASVAPSGRTSVIRSSAAGRASVYEGAAPKRQPLGALPAAASVSNVDPDLLAVFSNTNQATEKPVSSGAENLGKSSVSMAASSGLSATMFPGSEPVTTEAPGECTQQ